MTGRTNAGGSVNGSLFAIIAVTYPEGSVCTCGGKAAKDTGGYALFNVKPGTYTVECHTSDNSKSKSVSVTVAESDKGQAKTVSLKEVYLYNLGDECTSLTGGWTAESSYGSSGKASSYMYSIVNPSGNSGSIKHSKMVDLTDYNKLCFYLLKSAGKSTEKIYVNNTSQSASGAAVTLSAPEAQTEIALDISALVGSYYVGMALGDGSNVQVAMIWLE